MAPEARRSPAKPPSNLAASSNDEVAIVEEERDAAIERSELAEEHAAERAAVIQDLKLTIAALEGRLMGQSEKRSAAKPVRRAKVTSKPNGKGSVTNNAKADLQTDMFEVNDGSADADRSAA